MDFARRMIPHHRVAIDVACLPLQHGQDSVMRTLAQEVIDAQKKEIVFLKDWLRHPMPR